MSQPEATIPKGIVQQLEHIILRQGAVAQKERNNYLQQLQDAYTAKATTPEQKQYLQSIKYGNDFLPTVTDQASYDAIQPGDYYLTPTNDIKLKGKK
jgi:hypothetical protein